MGQQSMSSSSFQVINLYCSYGCGLRGDILRVPDGCRKEIDPTRSASKVLKVEQPSLQSLSIVIISSVKW